MNGDRIAKALARIEAASSRIETAIANRPNADPELEARYRHLRAEAEGVLEDVDALIAELEG
ncbi:hypothetical protein [Aurantiacibacter poecillastricola]|uniref:hypothetical protein n=1 Tax=Aurantiacibacter poecillastricola TaxID=3064385 RepID=UPI00273D1B84|nr:hypothetical protein [Aurantiacibacter sp. 219JJ12-13]MDP5261870.1 hypothetical protein [Aurantiacibacter sp. 219JJ12-13]